VVARGTRMVCRHELESRSRESEARHEELTARLPEATRPLLRQIEAMQAQVLPTRLALPLPSG
jgi:hypothetical protein